MQERPARTPSPSSPLPSWSISRLALALAAGLSIAAAPTAALAQSRDADPDLEALIPDAALDNPADWAKAQAPQATPAPEIDPAAPLAEGGFTLPWPDEAADLPALADLPPDPEVATALAALPVEAPTIPVPQGEGTQISDNLTLAIGGDDESFPVRTEFEARFKALSALERLGDSGDNIAQLSARARSDRELLGRLLNHFGYYDGIVTQSLAGVEPGAEVDAKNASIRFDVTPGPRYRFGKVDLADLPATGPDYTMLRGAFAIQSGDPMNNDVIVVQRDSLDVALGENGYAFAKLGEPDLLVDHKREEGDLTLPVTPGGKYHFGAIVSNDPKFLSSKHLQTIARFDPGDVYQRSLAEDLRRAVLATGLVSSVLVTPRETLAPTAGATGEVAVDVEMRRAPLRTIAGLIGYDSSDGFRAEASWEHRNFFPPEGMLRLRGIAGTKEQLAGATVRWNNFKGRDQVLTLDAYANTIKRTSYEARTVAFAATFEKLTTLLFQKPWVWSVGLEILATGEREGAVNGVQTPRTTYFIAALPLRAAYDGSDDLLDPTRGFRAALKVSPEVSKQLGGAQVTYARVQADASYYQSVSKSIVVAARARLGTIPGAAIADIAPSRRFYAGGGGSVRGYGYQQIGPRDTLGDPSGGRALSEFSLEARIGTGFFGGALQVVPFVDAGAVDETVFPTLSDLRFGAGIGVRYKTGFGPIRIDVGTPLNPRAGDSRIAVYVSLGQAF